MKEIYLPLEQRLQNLIYTIDQGNQEQLAGIFNQLHEADAAELIELLSPSYRQKMIAVIGDKFNPVILTYTDDAVKDSLIDSLAEHQLVAALSKIDEYDALELLEELTQEQRRSLLRTLRPELRIALEEGLSYPEGSAGRIMQHEFIALPANMLALQAAAFLHNVHHDTQTIFLVNQHRAPVAQLTFSNLLLAQPSQTLLEISSDLVSIVSVFDTTQTVGLAFRKYFISTLPVIDQTKRLVGIIQLHNIIDLIYDEAEEGLLQSAGVEESDFYKSLWSSVSSRIKWIVIAGMYSLVSAWIMSAFQDVIEKNAIIPALNQILLASIGTAGLQAVTITTRALVGKDLIAVNTLRAIRKETMIGVVNGIILSLGLTALLFFQLKSYLICAVFGTAVFLGTIIATLGGALIPILLATLKIDPSIGSTSLLASFADASGLLIILSLARYFL